MNPVLRAFLLLALLLAAPVALAQNCTLLTPGAMDFGSRTGVPIPATASTTAIQVRCERDLFEYVKVCVWINEGSGNGSSETDRRMSRIGGATDTIRFGLFHEPTYLTPVTSQPAQRMEFVFNSAFVLTQTKTLTLHGRVDAGQATAAAGQYESNLTVRANVQPYFSLSGEPPCNATPGTLTAPLVARFRLDPSCTIAAATMNFGTYNPAVNADTTMNLAVNCTRNGAWSIGLSGGTVANDVNARRMRLGAGPSVINYQLYRDTLRTQAWRNTGSPDVVGGVGTGAAQLVPVYGRVPAGQGAKPAGTYIDTVTATITY